MCICMHISLSMYIYIYVYVYTRVYMCVYIYIYIYMYTHNILWSICKLIGTGQAGTSTYSLSLAGSSRKCQNCSVLTCIPWASLMNKH